MHELGSDGTIHPAADCTNNATSGTAKFTDTCNLFPNEFSLRVQQLRVLDMNGSDKTYHRPIGLAFTDVENEPPDDLFTLRRVGNLRVELNPKDRLRLMCDCSKRCGGRVSDNVEIGGNGLQLIAMGHPYLQCV